MKVQDGRLVLPDGMSYRVLVLPKVPAMTPRLLAKIKDLAAQGATVLGAPPVKSPSLANYPKCDEEVTKMAGELWGDCDGKTVTEHRFGKGRILWGKTVPQALDDMGVEPDFTTDQPLRYTHRLLPGADVYFVANKTEQSCEAVCSFRIQGKQPELWRPDTGQIEDAAVYEMTNDRVRLPIRLDPAGSVFVVFRRSATAPDPIVKVTRNGETVLATDDSMSKRKQNIVITKAIYGVLSDPARTRDVRVPLQQLVDRGEWSFDVARMAETGDPAYGIVKTLEAEYTTDGKVHKVSGVDTQSIDISSSDAPEEVVAVKTNPDGRSWIEAWQPGAYELQTVSGRTFRATAPALPSPLEISGPWEVRFQTNRGAPPSARFDELSSWSDNNDARIKCFSGQATYTKVLTVPESFIATSQDLYLDLGKVAVTAEVRLNGKNLGILWKPPFRVNVTDTVKTGANTLEVTVANLWINRQIGDESLPDDSDRNSNGTLKEWPQWLQEGKPSPTGRIAFTSWRLWKKGDPLVESGLLGPVTLRAIAKVPVQ
jgi:hypothetical protein